MLPLRARFLAHEEATAAGVAAAVTGKLHAARSGGGRQQPSLFQLYKWATRVAPKSNSTAYLALWLGYARQQGCAHGILPCTEHGPGGVNLHQCRPQTTCSRICPHEPQPGGCQPARQPPGLGSCKQPESSMTLACMCLLA